MDLSRLAPFARAALIALSVALASACSKREPAPTSLDASPSVGAQDGGVYDGRAADGASPKDAAVAAKKGWSGPVGTVTGRVKLKKGATLPMAPPILGADGKPPVSSSPCPPLDASDRKTVAVQANTQGLSPVHVAITEFSEAPVRQARVYELFIDACRLRPTLLGAQSGDRVRVTNRSVVALLPSLPGDRFMQAILPGESREFAVSTLGTMLIGCNFANYCGETAVITLSHPLFAVSEPDGTFVIPNVPVGQKLMLHAWHPLFEVSSAPIELSDGGAERSLELELTPTSAATPAKPTKAAKPAKLPPADPATLR